MAMSMLCMLAYYVEWHMRQALKDLATITRNTIVPQVPNAPGWTQDAEPTTLQQTILEKIATISIV